jgi:hypothetical protein
MKTGQWLNINRNNTLTTEILGLTIVCAVAIPMLTLTLTGAIIHQLFKN